MPRPPEPPTPNRVRIGKALRKWMVENGIDQSGTGMRLGVSQSSISRAVNGRLREDDPVMHTICTGASIDLWPRADVGVGGTGRDVPLPDVITDALRRLWDGTPAGAEHVSRFLEAAVTLRAASDSGGARG